MPSQKPSRQSSETESKAGTESAGGAPFPIVVLVLVVAVLAISSSAVLILWADAPAVSVTFWRTLGGAIILAPAARRSTDRPTGPQWWIIAVSGVALGVHFATWLTSLELTSVAASVTLVSTVPIFIAVWLMLTGHPPTTRTWLAIGLAIVGTVIITVGDALFSEGSGSTISERSTEAQILGDLLALVGAATMAIYLTLGDRLRSTMSTAAYASRTYGFAAFSVGGYILLTGTKLIGFDTGTWLAIGAMVLGPQLAGHTALNYLLKRLGSVSVSLALLVEPIGAATLVWLIFDETPPLAAVLGGPIVLAAVAFQILARADRPDHGVGDDVVCD